VARRSTCSSASSSTPVRSTSPNRQFDGLSIAAALGYRALSTDYSPGSGFGAAGMNILFHGPLIGFGMRF
jgi:hypothetical protein